MNQKYIDFFSSLEEFNEKDWKTNIIKILNEFCGPVVGEYEYKNIAPENKKPIIWINNLVIGKQVNDSCGLYINNFYPIILYKLFQENLFEFDCKKFPKFFMDLLDFYMENRDYLAQNHTNARINMKAFLNSSFGLITGQTILTCNNPDGLVKKLFDIQREIFDQILWNLNNDLYYYDIDCFYFNGKRLREVKDLVFGIMKELNLKHSVYTEQHKTAFFFGRMKYIVYDQNNNILTTRGFRSIN